MLFLGSVQEVCKAYFRTFHGDRPGTHGYVTAVHLAGALFLCVHLTVNPFVNILLCVVEKQAKVLLRDFFDRFGKFTCENDLQKLKKLFSESK